MVLSMILQIVSAALAVPTTPASLLSVLMDDWFKACNGTLCCKDLRNEFSGENYTAVASLISWALLFLLLGTILAVVGVPAAKRSDSVKQHLVGIILFSVAGILQISAGIILSSSMDEVKSNALTSKGQDTKSGYFKTLRKFVDGTTAQQEQSNACHVITEGMTYYHGTSYALLWISVGATLASQVFALLVLVRIRRSKALMGYANVDN